MTDGITVTTPFGTSAMALLQALLLATSLWTLGAAACSPPPFTRLVVRWVLARRFLRIATRVPLSQQALSQWMPRKLSALAKEVRDEELLMRDAIVTNTAERRKY